jgi:hypothetical protein
MRDARAAVLLDAGADPQLIDVQIRLRRTLAQISTCAVTAVTAVTRRARSAATAARSPGGSSANPASRRMPLPAKVIRWLAPKRDDAVVIFGSGAVGFSAVMGARLAGCRTVVAVDPLPRPVRPRSDGAVDFHRAWSAARARQVVKPVLVTER